MLRSPLFCLLLLCLGPALKAQEGHPSNWTTDLAEAKSLALDQNAEILMVFAGSDWCHPCMEFKKEVLLSSAFEAYAAEHLVILYLDFPARKKNQLPAEQKAHNEALAERYNRGGAFPKIILLDPQEHLLAEPAFHHQTPEAFIHELEAIAELNP